MKKNLKQVIEEIKDKESKLTPNRIDKEKELTKEEVTLPGEFDSIISNGLDITFDFLAKKFGNKWRLEEKELAQLTNSYTALAEKYLPVVIGKYSIEINAMFCTAMILAKRITIK